MTSTVKVTAHCSDEKQVQVNRTGDTTVVLQDGEEQEFSIYDDQEVTAKEVLKDPA